MAPFFAQFSQTAAVRWTEISGVLCLPHVSIPLVSSNDNTTMQLHILVGPANPRFSNAGAWWFVVSARLLRTFL